MTLIARDSPATFAKLVGVVVVFNLAGNLIFIPPYGADGAAAVSLFASAAVLGAVSVWMAARHVGHVRFWRWFAAPVLASGAMTASALLVPGRWCRRSRSRSSST